MIAAHNSARVFLLETKKTQVGSSLVLHVRSPIIQNVQRKCTQGLNPEKSNTFPCFPENSLKRQWLVFERQNYREGAETANRSSFLLVHPSNSLKTDGSQEPGTAAASPKGSQARGPSSPAVLGTFKES